MREQFVTFESSLCVMPKTGRDMDRLREQLVTLAVECPYKIQPAQLPVVRSAKIGTGGDH